MIDRSDTTLAKVKIHPAVIVIGFLLAGTATSNIWKLNLESGSLLIFGRYSGALISAIGVGMLIVAYGSMARAATTINPSEHTTKIVKSGIYAYSRNPIYLGWFLVMAGSGLIGFSLFVLILSLLMISLLYWAVILEEEKYLENKFGEDYLSYKKNVRRWL